MSDTTFIGQVALGSASAVNLGDIFSGEVGGSSYALKCVAGTITLGMTNSVTAATGWPLPAGEVISVDEQSFRDLYAIGGAADRIAAWVVG
jgi:hypothetical protein